MFTSRNDAGWRLGKKLKEQEIKADLVLGIARGGVVVAAEVAKTLKLPLDVLVIKKLGAPGNPELAIGAITLDDVTYLDEPLMQSLAISKSFLHQEIQIKHHQLVAREQKLHQAQPSTSLENKRVIIVDDGIATGASMFVAIEYVKKQKVLQIILSVPVASTQSIEELKTLVDTCVILESAQTFHSVGQFYQNFGEVSEEEIIKILASRG